MNTKSNGTNGNGHRSVRTEQWRRMILLISITLLLPISVCAQDESQIRDALRIEKPPLKIVVRALTPKACIGTPLKLRIEVSNVGQETLRMNRAYFLNNYFEYPTSNEDKGGFITKIYPASTSEDIFLLAPGKKHVAHRYWSLDDSVTKFGAGNYTLEIRPYGILKQSAI